MNKKGFTLTEILTAVVIIAILTAMAVPLYEKTIERSRLTEARSVLNRLQMAKIKAMDDMECFYYSTTATEHCPSLKHLNVQFKFKNGSSPDDYTVCSQDFCYSLTPSGPYANGVCARRRGGDYAGTIFFYFYDEFNQNSTNTSKTDFRCYGTHCEAYGFTPQEGSINCAN